MIKDKTHGLGPIKLRDLPDDIKSKIDSKLTAGEPGRVVALWLQNECHVLEDVKTDTLKKNLERYREGALRNKVMARITDAQATRTIKTISKRLNALDELEEMVVLQRARVDKMLMIEEGKPVLLKSTTDEIKLLKDMLVSLGSMQMETGILPRASRTFKGMIQSASGEIKEFSWTEEQEQLYRELEGVIEQRVA